MPFCPNCGRPLQDGEKCSCQPEEESAGFLNTETLNQMKAKVGSFADAGGKKLGAFARSGKEKYTEIKKDPKKFRVLLIAAAVIVLVILILLIRGCSGSKGGATEPVDRLVEQINKGEKADYVELIAAFCPEYYRNLMSDVVDLMGDDSLEEELESMADRYDDLSDELGKWKLSFEVVDKEELSDDTVEDYEEEIRGYWDSRFESLVDQYEEMEDDEIEAYAELLDISEKSLKKLLDSMVDYYKTFKKADVSTGYKVRGYFILKAGKEEVDTTNKVTLHVLKINGDWAVYLTKDNDTFSFKDTGNESYSEYEFLTDYMNSTFKSLMTDVGF